MTVYPARWAAHEAMDAAWTLAVRIEGAIEDIAGALENGSIATAFEAAVAALGRLAALECAVAGWPGVTDEARQVANLAVADEIGGDALHEYAALPRATSATRADAEALLELVRVRASLIEERLPFVLPRSRTPEGFYPSVRVAKELENLRGQLGLPPYRWNELGL
jgi:hypothetical protein